MNGTAPSAVVAFILLALASARMKAKVQTDPTTIVAARIHPLAPRLPNPSFQPYSSLRSGKSSVNSAAHAA